MRFFFLFILIGCIPCNILNMEYKKEEKPKPFS